MLLWRNADFQSTPYPGFSIRKCRPNPSRKPRSATWRIPRQAALCPCTLVIAVHAQPELPQVRRTVMFIENTPNNVIFPQVRRTAMGRGRAMSIA